MSWKPEVIADSSGKWCRNGLVFETEKEAYESARDLAMRWLLVTDYRAAPSDEAPNYRYRDGKLEEIEKEVTP